jgi:DNA-directed RNA polymerase subunit M/transcription elongation factor TFIIS
MEQQIQKSNPLQQYFRAIKLYLKMPSGTSYYAPGIIDFTDTGEVGVLPMTGRDELILKNPDALLNGEALIEVLNSCVPALKNPRALLTNDIDALITAIRYATYNDSLETALKCPSCGHESTFKLNLQYALDNMATLDPEYVVNLESGLSIFVKPYAFPELLKGLHAKFEQDKLVRALESRTLTDEQRSAIVKKAFSEVATTKVDLITSGIVRIVDESNNVNVTDKKFIREFLQNIDKKSIDKIDDQITEINDIGIKRTFIAKCEKCEHEWENEIDFNPVNFS